jgi:cell division protein FtsQ
VAEKRRPRSAARARVQALPAERSEGATRSAPRRGTGATTVVSWLPSPRSLLIGAAIVAVATIAYVLARETPMFVLRTVEVRGAPPGVAAQVRQALEPLVGSSLVAFDSAEANRRLAALPDVAAATYDRDFPHTLRVFVRAEHGAAILRQGSEAWLVSGRARVLRPLERRPYPSLARVWLPATEDVEQGQTLDGAPARAVRTLAALGRLGFHWPVRTVRATDQELTLQLRSGLEVRLGDTSDLALKLEIARRIVPLAESALYIDVSVPERSVAGYPPQVSS